MAKPTATAEAAADDLERRERESRSVALEKAYVHGRLQQAGRQAGRQQHDVCSCDNVCVHRV